ncbi:MAG: hypothetical protein AAB691_01375 [Patescibacteria group bacterium]
MDLRPNRSHCHHLASRCDLLTQRESSIGAQLPMAVGLLLVFTDIELFSTAGVV